MSQTTQELLRQCKEFIEDVEFEHSPPNYFGLLAKLEAALVSEKVLRECGNADCGWIGETNRMCGAVGPLCPECGEVTEPA